MSQHFFLTGCASGIGRHLTQVFQKRGDKVFATDRNFEGLEAAAKELGWPEDRVRLAALDVTDWASWESVFGQALDAFGHIDVTMNIAGLLLSSWVHESPIAEIDGQVDVNIKGVMYGTRVSAAHMLERGQGHIINVASIAGTVPVPGMSVYCATKYAVRGYSLSAALEMRTKGVYVTAFCPASIQTPMLDNQEDVDAAEMFFSGTRILTLDEVEQAILRALKRKPYEAHLPSLKVKWAHLMDQLPWLGPLVAPFYQRSGRRRMAERRAKR